MPKWRIEENHRFFGCFFMIFQDGTAGALVTCKDITQHQKERLGLLVERHNLLVEEIEALQDQTDKALGLLRDASEASLEGHDGSIFFDRAEEILSTIVDGEEPRDES